MPERFVKTRVTDGSNSKGQIQLQSYKSKTFRNVASDPSGFTEISGLTTDQTTTTTTELGDRRETRTTAGVGKTVTQTEDKGAILKFQIPIQNRQPITRT
jgi:hypothetical protein